MERASECFSVLCWRMAGLQVALTKFSNSVIFPIGSLRSAEGCERAGTTFLRMRGRKCIATEHTCWLFLTVN